MVSTGYEFREPLRSTETSFFSRHDRGVSPTGQYLKFLNIDQFIWNKPASADPRALRASLTARHREFIERLARHVRLSWRKMRPIAFIRLIGHTDNAGVERHNLELGDWRARSEKSAGGHTQGRHPQEEDRDYSVKPRHNETTWLGPAVTGRLPTARSRRRSARDELGWTGGASS
jgi:hypothetical protein